MKKSLLKFTAALAAFLILLPCLGLSAGAVGNSSSKASAVALGQDNARTADTSVPADAAGTPNADPTTGSVIAVVIAVLAVIAVIALIIILVPKAKGKKG